MKKFIKIDYYIQTFLAFVVNPIGLFTIMGMMISFPIIGTYQIISDILHIYVFKTTYLIEKRKKHFFYTILMLILVPCVFFISGFIDEYFEVGYYLEKFLFGFCFIVFIALPEIMVWVRYSWARQHYLHEYHSENVSPELLDELNKDE